MQNFEFDQHGLKLNNNGFIAHCFGSSPRLNADNFENTYVNKD